MLLLSLLQRPKPEIDLVRGNGKGSPSRQRSVILPEGILQGRACRECDGLEFRI